MRASAVFAFAAILALAGCQESSNTTSTGGTGTTSSNATSGGGTSTTTESSGSSSVSATTTTPGAPVFEMSTDKSIEVAAPNGASSRLQYKDLKVGDGSIAENGKVAMVQYTGWLTDGTKFDSSFDHGQPLQFRIGEGRVIQGWERGVLGMRVGGKRRLVIPADLAYGERGYPPVIPGNATLVFEIEMVGLQ